MPNSSGALLVASPFFPSPKAADAPLLAVSIKPPVINPTIKSSCALLTASPRVRSESAYPVPQSMPEEARESSPSSTPSNANVEAYFAVAGAAPFLAKKSAALPNIPLEETLLAAAPVSIEARPSLPAKMPPPYVMPAVLAPCARLGSNTEPEALILASYSLMPSSSISLLVSTSRSLLFSEPAV